MKIKSLLLTAALCTSHTTVAQETDSGSDQTSQFDIGGPEGVTRQIESRNRTRDYLYDWPVFDGYFDWKQQIRDDYGVSFSVLNYSLVQQASDSLPDRDDNAFGNIFRFLGTWTTWQKDNGNLGRVEWRLESRSNLFDFQAPGSLASATVIATAAPGFGYSESFDMDVSVFNWAQAFANGRAGYAVGRLAFDVYLDSFYFQSTSRGFLNGSFLLNRTLPATGIGALGGVVRGFANDNVWVGAQIYDANAVSSEFDFDTVKEGEWLKAVEIGWTPSISQHKTHMIQFTYWDKDEREAAGVSDGSGWAVSAAWRLNDTYLPFVRFGDSDGGGGVAAETAVSAGVEISRPNGGAWTFGAGWARPSEDTFGPGLDDETVLEASYKFQVSKELSLLADGQVIFNPASNPNESSIFVIGIRAILTL